ncbi:14790_t:CDS:2, partial [Funneliformis geosporum]
MFKDCANCGQHKQIPPTETLCYACREKEEGNNMTRIEAIQKPTQAKEIDASEKDYLFYIADPGTTNEIKKMEIYSPSKGTEERTRLFQDAKEEFSELRRIYGIRHLTSKKEDRQNNPEIELNEAQFIALERDKQRERLKSIKEVESKGL